MKLIYLSVLIVMFSFAGNTCFGQQLSMDELLSIVNLPANKIDTLMKNKGYYLTQKEVDSTSSIYYYSNLEKNDENPVWVRSLSYMDVSVKNMEGRIVTYRTYNKEEYQSNLSFLLAHHFKTTHNFDFKESKHTIYENGRQSIRVKATNEQLPDGRMVKAYEFEIGK